MPIEIIDLERDYSTERGTRAIKILVAGPPGSGKTLMASTWPAPLFLDAEGGLLSIRGRKVHRVRITSLSDVEEVKVMLDQEPQVRNRLIGFEVQTVVLDTVDEIARIVMKERLRAERVETMRMQDWGHLADTMRSLLRGFRNLEGLNVIINVHLKQIQDEQTGRVEYRPDIPGSIGTELPSFPDIAGMINARPATDPVTGERVLTRVLQTFPDPQHDWLKDRSGALPQELPLNLVDDGARIIDLVFPALNSDDAPPIQDPAPSVEAAVPVVESTEEVGRESSNGNGSAVAPAKRRGRPPKVAPVEQAVEAPAAEVTMTATVESEMPAVEEDPLADLAADVRTCSECKAPIEPPEYADFSQVRFGVDLCREHFMARNRK